MKEKCNVFLLCIMLFFIAIAANATQVWDGKTKEPWTKGSGTESDPYLIETPANLMYLVERSFAGYSYKGTYFLQMDNMDLGKAPYYRSGIKSFSGHYDGGNHQIINHPTNLFYEVENANIRNITMTGSSTAPMIATAKGNTTLTNCHNQSAIITGAGLVGDAKNGCLTMLKCTNEAPLEKAAVDYDVKLPELPGGTGRRLCAGGLVAKASNIKMYRCANYANISVSETLGCSAVLYIGGLVGYVDTIYVAESFNLENITGKLSFKGHYNQTLIVYASGLIGKVGACGDISLDYNIGNVNAVGSSEAYSYGNGISNIKATYCYSKGTTSGSTDIGKYSYFVGYTKENTAKYSYNVNGILFSPTETYMRSSSFVSLLNSEADYFYPDYTNINDGYPILRWQLEGTTMYKIRATCPSAQGVVSGSGEYPATANITLKAMPKDGYTFTGWSDGNTDNPRTITVNGNATYVAQFSQAAYTIYVNQDCTTDIE